MIHLARNHRLLPRRETAIRACVMMMTGLGSLQLIHNRSIKPEAIRPRKPWEDA
jgi:hypothetical protein